ncbi:MAG: hypothetical protein KDK36_09230, partial [Leptospiraceae bacterium]|nr:hypothetical protein [Leptospiraceae bacterium]
MKIFINYFSKLILIAIPFIFHLSCLNLTRPFTKEIKEKYKFAKSGGIYYQERMLIGRDIKKVSIEKSQKGWRYKLHIIEESNSYKKPYDLCLNLDQKDIDTHTIDLEQQ